jgi:hypothetical protein
LPSSDLAKRFIWLAEAAKWEREAEAEIASQFEACNAVRPTCAADESCGLVIAWRTNCAVAQLAMNPLQQRAPFLLREVRKSKRSGDNSPIDHHLSSEKFNGFRPDANNLSSARTERHHPFRAVSRKTG